MKPKSQLERCILAIGCDLSPENRQLFLERLNKWVQSQLTYLFNPGEARFRCVFQHTALDSQPYFCAIAVSLGNFVWEGSAEGASMDDSFDMALLNLRSKERRIRKSHSRRAAVHSSWNHAIAPFSVPGQIAMARQHEVQNSNHRKKNDSGNDDPKMV